MHKIYFNLKNAVKPVIVLALLLAFAGVKAQVSLYGFSQQQGSYIPLENPEILIEPTAQVNNGSVDSQSFELPLPFTFSFAGQEHNQLWVYADGFVTFGPTPIFGNSPISNSNTSTPVLGAISALGTDLQAMYNMNGITGNLSYEVVGDAPNREFVIQWSHFRPYSGSVTVANYYDCSFQIRLKESHDIAMVYDIKITGSPTSFTSQVGLRGAQNTDFSTRYTLSNWTATTAGTSNSSAISTISTSLPQPGFTFNWAAPEACEEPIATASNLQFTVNGIIVNGSFTAASPAADKYLILRTLSGVTPNAPVNGTNYNAGANTALNAQVSQMGAGTTFTDNATNGMTGNTTYTYRVYTVNTACTGGPLYNPTPLQADVTTCPGPINTISTAAVTTTGFTINWVANNGDALPLNHVIEVSTLPDFSTQIEGSPFTVPAPAESYNVMGLQPATKYYFRLKAVTSCGSGNVSSIKNITTTCIPAESINETFAGLPSDALPACWSKIIRGTGTSNATVGVSITNGISGTPAISLYNSSSNVTTAGNDVILVSPQITNLTAGTHLLRFKARKSSASSGNELQIGTLSDNSSTAVFTPFGSTIILTTDYVIYTVDFSNYTGTNQYIGFRKAGSSTSTSAYIDDVVWQPLPTCLAPVNIVADNVTHSGVTVSWQFDPMASAPAQGYEYIISATLTPPASAEIVATNETTANITGLLSNTTYYLLIRSVCSDTEKSEWNSVNFTTKLAVPAPWIEDFATTATPAGWNTTGWQLGSARGATGNTGTNIYKNLYSGATTGNFTTVNVGPVPAAAEFSFDYKQSAYSSPYAPLANWGSFAIQVSTDYGATWATLATVSNEQGTGSYINKTYSLSDYEGDVVTFKISATHTAGDYDLSFDNFKIAAPAMGTDNFKKAVFIVYPNPATETITINAAEEIKSAKIYTVTGQLAGTYTTNVINVSALPAGAYIINIELEDGSAGSQKLIKG